MKVHLLPFLLSWVNLPYFVRSSHSSQTAPGVSLSSNTVCGADEKIGRAVFLEDDVLERLVKNCVFSDSSGLFSFNHNQLLKEAGTGTTAQIVQKHYDNRIALCQKGVAEWSDFEKLYISVSDVLNGSRVTIDREYSNLETKTSWTTVMASKYVKKMIVNIDFAQYIDNVSLLEKEAKLYPTGNINQAPVDLTIVEINKPKKAGDPPNCKQFVIDIPVQYQSNDYDYGFVIFTYRHDLWNNGQVIYPINDTDDQPRYVAVKSYINYDSMSGGSSGGAYYTTFNNETIDTLFGRLVRIGKKSKHELYNSEYWQNKQK